MNQKGLDRCLLCNETICPVLLLYKHVMAGVLGILKCLNDKPTITELLDDNVFGVTVRE